MIDDKFREEFKERFIEISKGIEDPNEEKEENEFDLGIDFSEKDVLSFEEEQEVDKMLDTEIDDIIDRVANGLTFIEDYEEEDEEE